MDNERLTRLRRGKRPISKSGCLIAYPLHCRQLPRGHVTLRGDTEIKMDNVS